MSSIKSFTLIWLAVLFFAASAMAQVPTPTPPLSTEEQQQQAEQQQKEQAAREEKALKLLDAAVAESRGLKLPENRIRVQFVAADSLWSHDEARARSLFNEAATNLSAFVQMPEANDRQQVNNAIVLRQEMLGIVAQRDAKLALDILRSTRPPEPPQQQNNQFAQFSRTDPESSLEFALLARIAANDPKQALKNAEEMLSKGEFSTTLLSVLAQLQSKDKEAAAKLTDDMLKGLRSENLSTNMSARNLTFMLLRPGPLTVEVKVDQKVESPSLVNSMRPTLDETSYRDLLDSMVNAALTVNTQTTTAAPANGARGGGGGGGRGPFSGGRDPNAMMTLSSVQSLLPQIDKYLPGRSAAVRQKLTAAGINADRQAANNQMSVLMQQGTVDSMLAAAPQLPPQAQPRIYQQAAMKAAQDGDLDRARQIAENNLTPDMRTPVLQTIERQQVVQAASQGKLEEAKQMLSRLRNDDDRVNAIIQISALLVKNGDKKSARSLLNEARNLVSRRAENYQQFNAQVRVAEAFAPIDPARSFEILDPGINQLNEMLSAAAMLNGFEVQVFKDDEMPLRGNSSLSGMIAYYARELAMLSRYDFDAAQSAADRFQRPEPRVLAKLSIASATLGGSAQRNPNSTLNRRNVRRGN